MLCLYKRLHPVNEFFLQEVENNAPRRRAGHDLLLLRPIHNTLRVTPAMAAGMSERLWDVWEIVALVTAHEARDLQETSVILLDLAPAGSVGSGYSPDAGARCAEPSL